MYKQALYANEVYYDSVLSGRFPADHTKKAVQKQQELHAELCRSIRGIKRTE